MSQTFSIAGAHLKCYVNNRLLGYVMAVPAWRTDSNWGELREIDSVLPKQLAPRLYRVGGTIQVLRGRYTGGAEGAGLVPSGEAMCRQKYLTIELLDRVSNEILFRGVSCVIDDQTWKIDRGLVVGMLTFKGLTFATEATR